MAITAESVVVEVLARTDRLEREIRKARNDFGRQLGEMERAHQATMRAIERDAGRAGASLKALAGSLAGAFSVREIQQLADAYTTFTNTLRVAGVEGAAQAEVQKRLFDAAQRNGVEIGALGELYGRAAQAGASLGATQADLLKFTDGVSAALRVQGGTVESASGALLQLAQALQAGTVRAEEFNSINEGAFPILQAVAAGADRFGGSVAKLRAAVLDGTVSSQEFFRAFLKGSDELEARAAKAALTTAQGFVVLRNALTVYFGEADKAQGASAALGQAIKAVADNLDILVPALAAIATGLGVGYVTSAIAARAATVGLGASLLSAFGGPVGIAITGVTVALASFQIEAANANALVARANAAYQTMRDRLDSAAQGAAGAADGSKQVGSDALGAIPKVDRFAGAVGNLADQLYRQARAARVARIETLQSQLAASQADEKALGERSLAGRRASAGQIPGLLRSGNILAAGGIVKGVATAGVQNLFSGGQYDRDIDAALSQQVQVSRDLQRQIREATAAPITPADMPAGLGGMPGGDDGAAKAIAKRQKEIADLERLRRNASGSEAKRIESLLAQKRRQLTAMQNGISASVANSVYGAGTGRARREELSPSEYRLADVNAPYTESPAPLEERFARSLPQIEGIEDAAGNIKADFLELGELDLSRTFGPLAAYLADARDEAANLNLVMEAVAVDGFDRLGASIADAITGTRSLGSAFKEVANQIIQDLIRIAVRQVTVKTISSALGLGFSEGGMIPGYSSGGLVRGPGTGKSDSILASAGGRPIRLSDGEFVVNAEDTAKNLPLLQAINAGAMRPMATGGMIGANNVAVMPAGGARGGAPSQTIQQSFDLRGAVVTEKLYADLQRMSAEHASSAARYAAADAYGRTMHTITRRPLPGSLG